jgi:hypothetical protein
MGNSVEGTSTYDDKLKIMKEGNSCPAPPLLVYKQSEKIWIYKEFFDLTEQISGRNDRLQNSTFLLALFTVSKESGVE